MITETEIPCECLCEYQGPNDYVERCYCHEALKRIVAAWRRALTYGVINRSERWLGDDYRAALSHFGGALSVIFDDSSLAVGKAPEWAETEE